MFPIEIGIVNFLQSCVTAELAEVLRRQKYQTVGRHSAAKKCHWLHKSLTENHPCYKQKFYGIQSHRCLQMTPTLICNMRCKFCWRIQPEDVSIPWTVSAGTEWDDPRKLVEECFKAQLKILSGYNGQVLEGKVDPEKYFEALHPRHVAISLDGEPTLYPSLGSLIHEFKRNGLTVFLVTNGTNPKVLESLNEEPSQLYISLCAPDPSTFVTVCRPSIPDAWENLMKTLSMLPSFSCPTAIRTTLVRDLNLNSPEEYAKLLRPVTPTYVEPKSYMYVGYSRSRLSLDSMPSHKDVVDFSRKLAAEMSYKILDESPESRVVLLSRLEKSIKIS